MPTRKRRAAQGVRSPDRRQNPTFVTPMAALQVDVLPEGPEWSYELKLDGYRALIIKDGSSVRIRSRNDKGLMKPYVLCPGKQLAQMATSGVFVVNIAKPLSGNNCATRSSSNSMTKPCKFCA